MRRAPLSPVQKRQPQQHIRPSPLSSLYQRFNTKKTTQTKNTKSTTGSYTNNNKNDSTISVQQPPTNPTYPSNRTNPKSLLFPGVPAPKAQRIRHVRRTRPGTTGGSTIIRSNKYRPRRSKSGSDDSRRLRHNSSNSPFGQRPGTVGGQHQPRSFLPPTGASIGAGAGAVPLNRQSAVDRLMMRPGTTGGMINMQQADSGMSSMLKYGQVRKGRRQQQQHQQQQQQQQQRRSNRNYRNISGGSSNNNNNNNNNNRYQRRVASRQGGVRSMLRGNRSSNGQPSPYGSENRSRAHHRSQIRARSQSRNRNTRRNNNGSGSSSSGNNEMKSAAAENGNIISSPISRIGFIEPPPPSQNKHGLKIVSPLPTTSDRNTASSPARQQKLSNGSWKRYFGVFSMGGERRTQYSAIPQPKENQDSYGMRASFPQPTLEVGNDRTTFDGVSGMGGGSQPKTVGLLPTFCFGVFDGHGRCGQNVSKYVAKKVPARVLTDCTAPGGGGHAYGSESDIRRACTAAFKLTQQELRTQMSFDTKNSGSTAVACVLRGRTLTLCNVGDSRCVLASAACGDGSGSSSGSSSGGGSSGSSGGVLRCTALTDDHKPTRPDEMARVIQCGGSVEPTKFNGQFMGPDRVWMHPQRVGGLAVSRAMGDCAYLAAGVIAKPEITVQRLISGEDLFLVLGSDGIYDHMTNEEVVKLVQKCMFTQRKTPEQTAKILVTEARRKWRSLGMGYVDDVTAIVVDLSILGVLMEGYE